MAVGPGGVLFTGGSPVEPGALVQLDPDTGAVSVLRRSSPVALDLDSISRPEAVEFLTADGPTTQALYYRPRNANFRGPDGERQPLLVKNHGGDPPQASSD